MLKKAAACAALVVAMLATLLALPASAVVSIDLLSSSQWGPDSLGLMHIVGEVVNNGDQTAELIEIDADLKDSGGQLLDTALTFTHVERLNPGGKAVFELIFEPPAGYAQYTLSVLPDPATLPANQNFTVTVTNQFTDGDGTRHFVGTVRNNNTTLAENTAVIFTFYGPEATAVTSEFTFPNTSEGNLQPGQTASFEVLLFNDEPSYTSFAVIADSPSAPSPAAASPSPTATPTPTTTHSPNPTGQAPTLVAPATATAGILITVSGTAAPGAVVELWGVTAPNGTITRVNTPTVTADANGNWAKQIRPLRNVNLQARVGDARSATRFIAVKTDVTQSVAPLAGCVVQVSGRVFEPKPGRTVFIRALDAANRTVSLGTGSVQSDGRFLLRKPYACGQTLRVYTVIEGDAVNRPGATGTQIVTTRG